jgi:predicted alpha/beta superfamily hydrolase
MNSSAEHHQNTKKTTYSAPKTLTLELTTPVDDRRPVYVVGNFNNWTVDESRFEMRRVSKSRYVFTFPSDVQLPRPFQYKYVRGGWENQELDNFGNATENRALKNPQGVVTDIVPRWTNYGLTFNPSYRPKIEVVDEAFFMPQLNKKRRVIALLPYNYHTHPEKRYPVLYMNDGQNLFDDKSPFGNWGIDRKLAVLAEKGMGDLIVIAIDHGGDERTKEFLPPKDVAKLDKSEAYNYVHFVAQTLKKHVDERFRTLPNRIQTGIGGSSLGGLIAIYAGLMYPSVFGRLLIFSPSLWAMRNVALKNVSFSQPIPTKIYAYGGGLEGSNMVPNIDNLQQSIRNQGFDETKIQFKKSIDPAGLHNERRWGQEFPKAVEWLFFS